MPNHDTPKGKHLTIGERRLIEQCLKDGKSRRDIAGLLDKAPQTINNAVKRGQVRQQVRKGKFEQVYSADYAQELYDNNRKHSVKTLSLTNELKEKIIHYIKQKFSPEMIVKAKEVKKATKQQVAFIGSGINNYPKKILGYKSPKEFLKNG